MNTIPSGWRTRSSHISAAAKRADSKAHRKLLRNGEAVVVKAYSMESVEDRIARSIARDMLDILNGV